MSLRFTPQALADAKRIKTWWRQNRPGAPDAFDQELGVPKGRVDRVGVEIDRRGIDRICAA
jgi:P2-related tail formation protein